MNPLHVGNELLMVTHSNLILIIEIDFGHQRNALRHYTYEYYTIFPSFIETFELVFSVIRLSSDALILLYEFLY